jgi:hypothetical protein
VNWTGASSTAWSNAGNWTGGTGIPVAADTVIFGAAGSSTTQGTVTNVVDTDFTIAALRFENQSDNATPQFHTTQIDPTKTLLDNGGNTLLHVGSLNNAATAFSVYETITGSGTFTLNNTGGTVQIRQGSVAGSFTGRATLDMSGLANFNANVSNFRIGFGEGSTTNFNRATGTAILAANNTITAANLTVASGSASTGGTSQLTLGQNNTFNVGLFEVGTRKSTGMVNFNSAVSGGNLVIRAQNGTGRANLTIGLAQASEVTTSNGVGTIDLTGATGNPRHRQHRRAAR